MKKSKKFEENYFEGWFKGAVGKFSDRDLEMSRRWFFSWLKKLEQHVPLENEKKNKKVLEIGSAIGGVASLLHERGFSVYASDISDYAMQKAKKLSPDVHFSTFDVQKKIPLKQKFDYVMSFEVVEHLRFPQKSINNMVGSLKKDGYLIFSTPYPYPWVFSDPTHISVKYPHEWVAMMKKAGLKEISYHKFSLLPFFYRLNKNLQIIIPFHLPYRYMNTPIFYIGKKQ